MCIVEMESGRSPLARCPFGVGQGLRFLSESRHTGQRFVDGFGGGECLLDFGLQNNHVASLRELLAILAPHANPKLLALQFRNVLVILACRWFLHNSRCCGHPGMAFVRMKAAFICELAEMHHPPRHPPRQHGQHGQQHDEQRQQPVSLFLLREHFL
jgi:hypothetical protein